MRMVNRIIPIYNTRTQLGKLVGNILPVIHKTRVRPGILNNDFTIPCISARAVGTGPTFARIIRSRGGDDNVCAVGDNGFGSVREVCDVCLDDKPGRSCACFVARANTVGASVVHRE
jgi:hypothetical protein